MYERYLYGTTLKMTRKRECVRCRANGTIMNARNAYVHILHRVNSVSCSKLHGRVRVNYEQEVISSFVVLTFRVTRLHILRTNAFSVRYKRCPTHAENIFGYTLAAIF